LKKCLKCGTELEDNAKFCVSCGSVATEPRGAIAGPYTGGVIHNQKPGSGTKFKIIICTLLAVILVTGSFWGWKSFGTEAQVQSKLDLAVKYLSENKYDEAILAYQEVIKIESKNVTAYKGISLAYTLQKKPDQAEQALQDGLEAISQNPQLQLAMAGLMVDQGKGDQAEAIYKELVGGASPTLSSYQAYTYYLNQKGKSLEAIALLEQALAKNNQDYILNSILAELYLKNGDKERALTALNKSMTAQLDQSTSYKLLDEMYKDKWDDLIALGDQYIQQNKAKTGQILKLSGLLGMGKYDDVIKLYGELTTDLKDNTRARFIAAQAYTKLGQKDQSIELMKPIKIADLKDAGMLAHLANYYLENKDKDSARKLALQGIGVDESALENYAVMYKSYVGEDENIAQIWAFKYLLKSELGYKGALMTLAEADIFLKMEDSSGDSSKTELMRKIVETKDSLEKRKSEYKGNTSTYSHGGCYLDIEKNIAYVVFMFTPSDQEAELCFGGWTITSSDQLWKNIVFRIHNPKVILVGEMADRDVFKEDIERKKDIANKYGISQAIYLGNLQTDGYYIPKCYPILVRGNSFENDLAAAGMALDSIIFVDVS